MLRTRIALTIAWFLFACQIASAQSARMKVVLDTDIGTDIDDAWALGYARTLLWNLRPSAPSCRCRRLHPRRQDRRPTRRRLSRAKTE
jgi:hypothetical protein